MDCLTEEEKLIEGENDSGMGTDESPKDGRDENDNLTIETETVKPSEEQLVFHYNELLHVFARFQHKPIVFKITRKPW